MSEVKSFHGTDYSGIESVKFDSRLTVSRELIDSLLESGVNILVATTADTVTGLVSFATSQEGLDKINVGYLLVNSQYKDQGIEKDLLLGIEANMGPSVTQISISLDHKDYTGDEVLKKVGYSKLNGVHGNQFIKQIN